MRHSTARLRAALAVTVALLSLSGCGTADVTYVDEGGDYAAESALALATQADPGSLADSPSAEAESLRHDALVSLRRQGARAAEAASLITKTFPSDIRGVPYYVERGTYESQPAVIVVEAIGRGGGDLTDRRLWVLSESGQVLLSGTR